jgi:citrate lyase subunit alpha/citrate CoA-transferase
VGCVTTPGETIDAVVTEAGVAVNPRRADLAARLKDAGLPLLEIAELHQRANALDDAAPAVAPQSEAPIVGVVQYRDGSVIDVLRRVG